MNCSSCVRHVTDAIQNVAGVASTSVSLEQSRAVVRLNPAADVKPQAIVDAVARAGYQASYAEPQNASNSGAAHDHADHHDRTSPGWKLNVYLGGSVTVLLMVGEWVFSLGMDRWFQWLAFFLALPVQILCGAQFYRGAWNQLKVGSSNMDTLVALGSTTAFVYSVWGLLAGWSSHLYFMEAAGIITLISVGHWMEARMAARAASSLRALMELAPLTARKLDAQRRESEVSVADLVAGDQILLKPGDRVPTDGDVVEGASAVDESMLTGESLPVDKAPGTKLYAGTVNQNGKLVARVTETGESTALAHIIAVVERAQNSRASIQKLGDKVSSIFVPIVVLIALATALWWGLAYESAKSAHHSLASFLWHASLPDTVLAAAVIHAAAVLIIACPCAMGLATPVAIMAGTNVAARRGILIRDGAALEKSGTITAVLFDKTGTLTEGRLKVAAIENLQQSGRETELGELAASLAQPSHHPLSRAVAAHASAHVAIEEWQELRGAGVQARSLASHQLLRMGSLNWLDELRINTRAANAFRQKWTNEGATVLGLAVENELTGVIALRDTLKPAATEIVSALRDRGLKGFLVTGDNRATATAIARLVGIPSDNVFAEVRPERKAEIVRELQSRGERVAFVGDGINDAPALEQADLGIAVSKASDVAREAADIILLKSDIQAIPEAIGLAQATLRTIKQNLFWAFFYNAAAIPLAVLGFLSPLLCAAAMGLSDVVVIGNALRLRRF